MIAFSNDIGGDIGRTAEFEKYHLTGPDEWHEKLVLLPLCRLIIDGPLILPLSLTTYVVI